ncbi:MAG: DsbA family protein, partial [Bacteroidota bacterium]
AHSLQQALYREGIDLDEWKNYGPLAAAYGWNPTKFIETIQRPETATMTYQEFELVQEWGIMGFPSVVIQQGEKVFALARGYLPYDSLEANLKQILSS